MGWVEKLRGKTIFVDTSPFIFLIEQHPRYVDPVRSLFEAVHRGDSRIVTSTVTLLEVLVHPMRHGDEALAQNYNDILLSAPNIKTVSLSPHTAQVAAEIRATQRLKTPDAIQIDTAITQGADVFLTNDDGFKKLTMLEMVLLHDLVD